MSFVIMLLLGVVQIIFIVGILVFELRNRSSSVFLWGTLLIMFGIPHFLSSFTGDAIYTRESISEASLFVIGFCIIYFLFRVLFGKRISTINNNRLQYDNFRKEVIDSKYTGKILLLLLIIVVVFKLVPFVKSSGGLLNTSWGSGRAYTSELSYTNSNQITSILFYTLSGIIVYYWMKREYVFLTLAVIVYLADVIITRNRIEVLPLLCALIIIPILKNKRVSLKLVLLGCIGIVAVIYIVYGLWVFRHYGSLSSFINEFNLSDFVGRINDHLRNDTDNGELNYRKWFYYFIQNNNEFTNFNRGHSYIRMLLVYIPTQWSLGLKPPDFAQSMGSAIGMIKGGSMHPTLFGDCYANLNVFGIFLGAFWAIYVTVADRIVVRRDALDSILLFSINAVAFVIIGRGSVYNPFFFIAYGVPLIIILGFIRNHIHFNNFNNQKIPNNQI